MGGGSETDSHSTTTTQLPQWVQDAGQANYGVAQGLATQANPYYQGQTTAGTTAATAGAQGAAWDNMNNTDNAMSVLNSKLAAYNPNISADPAALTNASSQGYTGAQAAASGQVKAGQLANTDLSPYMNPYINDVVNKSMTQLNQQSQITANQNSAQAAAAGAFGGSRAAVQQGVADAQTAQNAGLLSSQLYSAGFDNAQQAATGDINRRLTADTTNVGNTNAINEFNAGSTNQANQFTAGAANTASLANAASANSMAQFNSSQSLAAQQAQDAAVRAGYGLQLTGAQQASALNNTNATTLGQFGAAQQATNQAALSGKIAQYNQNAAYPQQQLGLLESALGMTPYNTTTQSDGTVSKSQSPDFASIGLGAMKMFNPFASMMPGTNV